MITIKYVAIDGTRMTRQFKTLKAAQRFAQKYVGEYPELGGNYAVSRDGVGKVIVLGDASILDIFPAPPVYLR